MKAIVNRIGRRGAILILFGTVWIVKAYTLFRGDKLSIGSANLLNVPLSAWGAMWLISGAVAIGFAFKPFGRDHYGYAAAVLPAWVWAIGYFQGWERYGHGAWTTALTWLVYSLVILIAAGWQEVREKSE